MATPRKGTARWVEDKLHGIAERLESDTEFEPARAKAQIEAIKAAYETRLARAAQIRNQEDPETYIEQAESGEQQLLLIEGRKVG